MSCYRELTADVLSDVEKELLHVSLQEIGLDFDESVKIINTSFEGSYNVDAALTRDGNILPLGLKFNVDEQHHMQIVGDFWGTGIDHEGMMADLTQQYVVANLSRQLEEYMGYEIVEKVVNSEGKIEIIAQCA